MVNAKSANSTRLFMASEFSKSSPSVRMASDLKQLNEIIKILSLSIPYDSNLFRLDRVNAGKLRPLKVIFRTKEYAHHFVYDLNTGKHTVDLRSYHLPIRVSRDRTLLECNGIRRVYEEFDSWKKQGEHNIVLRSRNGVPHIICNDQNTSNSRPFSAHV